MKKIILPSNIEDLKDEYFSLIYNQNKKDQIEDLLTDFCSKHPKFAKLKAKDFFVTSMDITLIEKIKEWAEANYNSEVIVFTEEDDSKVLEKIDNKFYNLFNYESRQSEISQFIAKHFKFKICFYCQEQYVFSFVSQQNCYSDYLEFLNKAPVEELSLLNNIGDKSAQTIFEFRKKHEKITVDNIKFLLHEVKKVNKKFQINNYDIEEEFKKIPPPPLKYYFTLDHLIPKGTYPFLSLNLFNLVPSCYACNSKFKHSKEFALSDINKISPYSSQFSLNDDMVFNLDYELDKTLTRSEINEDNKYWNLSYSDFSISVTYKDKCKYVEDYLKMFYIKERYSMHNDQIAELVKMRIHYPETEIKKLMKTTGRTEKEIKQLIFGNDLINKNEESSLFKLKSDIAKQFEII